MPTTDSRQTGDKWADGRPNPRPYLIRPAEIDDAHAIAEIAVAGWQAACRGILPAEFLDGLSVAAREIAWRAMLEADPGGRAPTWVAQREGRVTGFVSTGPPRDGDVSLPAAEVYALYVLQSEWRSGCGRSLLDAVVRHWLEAGVATLLLWVLERNDTARAFYEAIGWVPDGGRQELEMAGERVIEVRYRLGAGGSAP